MAPQLVSAMESATAGTTTSQRTNEPSTSSMLRPPSHPYPPPVPHNSSCLLVNQTLRNLPAFQLPKTAVHHLSHSPQSTTNAPLKLGTY